MDLWFTEDVHDGWQFSVRVEEVLVTERSEFQRIDILQTRDFGRMLVLDGKVQACELDEFIYHEMLAHVPLLCHSEPKRVLVAGGGDGGALREVFKHPSVTEGVLVDIDRRVIELCQEFMPALSASVAEDPRLVQAPADAAEYLREARDLDVILVDSSDPVGPSEKLFSKEFYQSLYDALSEDGLVSLQAGSPLFFRKQVRDLMDDLKQVFRHAHLMALPMPTYPGGYWTLAVASKKVDPCGLTFEELTRRYKERGLTTRYYDIHQHFGSMKNPPFMQKLLSE